jgi:hypothetical protein
MTKFRFWPRLIVVVLAVSSLATLAGGVSSADTADDVDLTIHANGVPGLCSVDLSTNAVEPFELEWNDVVWAEAQFPFLLTAHVNATGGPDRLCSITELENDDFVSSSSATLLVANALEIYVPGVYPGLYTDWVPMNLHVSSVYLPANLGQIDEGGEDIEFQLRINTAKSPAATGHWSPGANQDAPADLYTSTITVTVSPTGEPE